MSKTLIADIMQGRPFADYVDQETTVQSKLISSGIISMDESISSAAAKGGSFVDMPFWNDLTGSDEVLSDTVPLTPGKITTGQDVAVKLIRGRAWAVNELASVYAGSSGFEAVGRRLAVYRANQMQQVLLSTLKGVFVELAGSHVLDVTGASGILEADTILDAKQLLGDAAGGLTAIAMHSAKYTDLQKQNLIAYIPNARGEVNIPTYLGYRVIFDDSMPMSAGNYTSYLFGSGAVAYADVAVPNAVEQYRDALYGVDGIVLRKGMVLHCRGVKYNSTDAHPDNAALETDVWTKVYDNKNIRVVKLVTK